MTKLKHKMVIKTPIRIVYKKKLNVTTKNYQKIVLNKKYKNKKLCIKINLIVSILCNAITKIQTNFIKTKWRSF